MKPLFIQHLSSLALGALPSYRLLSFVAFSGLRCRRKSVSCQTQHTHAHTHRLPQPPPSECGLTRLLPDACQFSRLQAYNLRCCCCCCCWWWRRPEADVMRYLIVKSLILVVALYCFSVFVVLRSCFKILWIRLELPWFITRHWRAFTSGFDSNYNKVCSCECACEVVEI